MNIQPSPCCSSAYGPRAGRTRIILLIAAAVLAVAVVIAERRDSGAVIPVVRESIVVRAESPRAVLTKSAAKYSVHVSDMRDQLSVLVTDRDGSAVPLRELEARASYTPRGGTETNVALDPMNDHLMAAVDPSQSGAFTVALASDGVRQQMTFELPLSQRSRRTS